MSAELALVDGELTRTCRDCGVAKPLALMKKNRACKYGVQRMCNACSSEREMRQRDANPDIALNSHLLRKFGITLARYNELLEQQGGVCAICGEPPASILGHVSRRQGCAVRPRLVVDHCHETGQVRGLLCTRCNRGIGFLKDSTTLVASALGYLQRAEVSGHLE